MKNKPTCSECVLITLVVFLLFGYLLGLFGSGKGPTTSKKILAPTGEVVSYETYYVSALQDPGRDYLFYYQSNASSPRERMGRTFPGPGEPIPLNNVRIYRFTDRMILIVDSVIFGRPDSYVFFHSLPYENGAWSILYNKRDNFRVFDRVENDGKTLIERGLSPKDDMDHDFAYNVTSLGALEEKSSQPDVTPK